VGSEVLDETEAGGRFVEHGLPPRYLIEQEGAYPLQRPGREAGAPPV
jgi:hypothetical protein